MILQAATAGGHSLAFTHSVDSGNLLVVSFSSHGAVGSITVSDTLGTSYALAASVTGYANNMAVYYGVAPASGSNTVTIGGYPNNTDRVGVVEMHGVTATVNQTTTAFVGSGTVSQSITPSVNSAVVCFIAGDATWSFATSNLGINTQSGGGGANGIVFGNGYASTMFNFTANGLGNNAVVLVAFPGQVPPNIYTTKANSYTVAAKPTGINATKASAYTVLVGGAAVTKANTYTTVDKPSALSVSKALAYVVLGQGITPQYPHNGRAPFDWQHQLRPNKRWNKFRRTR